MPRDPAGPGPGFPPVGLRPLARKALHGWLLLGAGALAIAGTLALLLALMRSPGAEAWLPWPPIDSFRKILVSHVVFAFVLWFWAIIGALTVAAKGNGRAGLAGLGLAAAGAALVLIPPLAGLGEPALANYIPVLVDPTFMAGLALFAAGVAVPAAHLLLSPVRQGSALALGVATAGALFILAAICVALAWQTLPAGADPLAHVDTLVWGGGHVLQFAYTALALAGWQALGAQAFGSPPLGRVAWRIVCGLLLAAALPGPVFYLALGHDPAALRQAFTTLYWIGLPLPVGIAAAALAAAMRRGPRDWRSPAFLGAALSLGLFLLGAAMGLFADGADTRTPAHYHAEIGGVNLALIGLVFAQLLPALGRAGTNSRAVRLQFWLYGLGQAAASLGLFLAGSEGVARKIAGMAQGLDTAAKQGGMGLAGAGGVVAVAGGVLFIWLALRRLLTKGDGIGSARPNPSPSRGGAK